jgi:hypothetical protein
VADGVVGPGIGSPAAWPVAPWRSLPGRHVDAARAAQASLGPGLAAMRAVPLPFLGTTVEPTHALRWLDAPAPSTTTATAERGR